MAYNYTFFPFASNVLTSSLTNPTNPANPSNLPTTTTTTTSTTTSTTINLNMMTNQPSSIIKRPFAALVKSEEPEWHICKRPRRVSTPNSAISAVTAENEALPISSDKHHDESHLDSLTPSPTFSVDLSIPPPPPLPELVRHGQTDDDDDDDDAHHDADGIDYTVRTPTFSPDSNISPVFSSQSQDGVASDLENSFASGDTGAVAWNHEMLVQVLTNDVEDLCYVNERCGARGASDEYHNFFSQYKQPFELEFYIQRLVQYSNCSTAAFVVMLVYLDRIQENCKELLVTELNCHRLVNTALVLAIKYLDDEVFSNTYYARVGGVTGEEMNEMEVKLLKILDWNLSVSPETFLLYEEGLIDSATVLSQETDAEM